MKPLQSPLNECGSDLPTTKESALVEATSPDSTFDGSDPTPEDKAEAATAELGETAVFVQVLADAKAISHLDERIARSSKSCIEGGVTREVVASSIPGTDAGFIFQGRDEKQMASKTFQSTAHARVGNAELICFARGKSAKLARESVTSCMTDLVGGIKVLPNAATTASPIAGKTLLTTLSTPTRRVRISPLYPPGVPICDSLKEPFMEKETTSDVFTPEKWASQPEKSKDVQYALIDVQTEKDAAAAKALVAQGAKAATGCTGETKRGAEGSSYQTISKDLGSEPATVADGGFVVTHQMQRVGSTTPPSKFRTWIFSIGPHVLRVSENQWGQADQILKDLDGLSARS